MEGTGRYLTVLFMLFCEIGLLSAQPYWQNIGGPSRAEKNFLDIISTADGKALAITGNGLYQSPDGGVNWDTTSLLTSPFYCLYRSTDGMLFAGANFRYHYSANNGAEWLNVYVPMGSVKSIIKTANGRIIAASGATGANYISNGIGDSWQQINGLSGESINTICSNDRGILFAGSNNGIFRSDDNGTTWMNCRPLQPDPAVAIVCLPPNLIIAGIRKNFGDGYLLSSSDDGLTWSSLEGAGIVGVKQITADSGNNIYAAVDKLKVLCSTDRGVSWSSMNSGLPNISVNRIFVNSSGLIIAAANAGLYTCTTQYPMWKTAGSWKKTPLNVLEIEIDSTDRIWVTTPIGLFTKNANASEWEGRNSGFFDNTRILAIKSSASRLLFAGTDSGFFRSADNGLTWARLPVAGINRTVNSIVIKPGGALFVTFDTLVYRSNDDGLNWENITGGLLGGGGSLKLDSAGNLYHCGIGLNYSTDEGITWTTLWGSGGKCWTLNSSGHAFHVVRYSNMENMWEVAYVTTDHGAAWQTVWRRNYVNVTSLWAWHFPYFIIVINSRMIILVNQATAESWDISQGAAAEGISLMTEDKNKIVYLATNLGVFKSLSPLTSTGSHDPALTHSPNFTLQNYPNPFNMATNIEYELPEACQTTLAVYDVIGRKIKTLLSGREEAGRHEVRFYTDNLNSGVYFYVLTAGSLRMVKKMVLLK